MNEELWDSDFNGIDEGFLEEGYLDISTEEFISNGMIGP